MSKLYLGIESTAHTFGIGIVDSKGKILANERSVYRPEEGAGFIPAEMAIHHTENADKIIEEALKKVKLKIDKEVSVSPTPKEEESPAVDIEAEQKGAPEEASAEVLKDEPDKEE